MPAIQECRFTAIDFESAGAAPGRTDAPVQVGIATWSTTSGHSEQFVSYLKTQQEVTWSARKVHGIGPEQLAGAPPLLTLWPEIKRLLTHSVVVAHGKGTEKRFLRAFPGHGFGPWIDTLLLSRAAWPHLPDHSLGAILASCGLTSLVDSQVPGKRWHDALYDAVASLILLEHLIATYTLGAEPIECLLSPNTSTWHRSRRG